MAFKRLDFVQFSLFSLYPSHLLQLQQYRRFGFVSFNGSGWCQSTGMIKRPVYLLLCFIPSLVSSFLHVNVCLSPGIVTLRWNLL